jgi:hypothetical protein
MLARGVRLGLYAIPKSVQDVIAEEILLRGESIPERIEVAVLRKKAETIRHISWNPSDPNHLLDRVSRNSLLKHAKNVFSQCGDDGILEAIFGRLEIRTGYFVEFGAWDGIYLSNSRLLFCRGWSGAFIEADGSKFGELRSNYRDFPQIQCINEMVKADPGASYAMGRSLDQIWRSELGSKHVDFLSIDIDGLDYRILETLEMRPMVICVEGGFAWHPDFTKKVPDSVAGRNLQQPLSVLTDIARQRGYVPVCFNQNTFLVDQKWQDRFVDTPKDAKTLWMDAWFHRSDAFRSHLIEFRSRDRDIREWEGTGLPVLEL